MLQKKDSSALQGDVHILIQARMGSRRLPGKSLLPFGKSTVVGYLYNSLIQHGFSSESISFVIPDSSDNDILSDYLSDNKISFFRGAEKDVPSRYIEASKHVPQETIVRLTADNPLISTTLIEYCIKHHLKSKANVTSTRLIDEDGNIIRYAPKGSSVDIFNKDILGSIDIESCSSFEREHVIPAIFKNTEVNAVKENQLTRFGVNLKRQEIISIDTQQDYLEALKCLK